MTYSVAVSFFEGEELQICLFPNFKDMFDSIFDNLKIRRDTGLYNMKAVVNLTAHNGQRYDNHYLRKDIQYYYPDAVIKNMYLKNAKLNLDTIKIKDIKKDRKIQKSLIVESRIKSSINLNLDIYLKGVHFKTTDTLMKTSLSLATLGKKLLRLGVVSKSELKTDFDYLEFNQADDMSDKVARHYASQIFHTRLTEEHFTYIRNDVILLAKTYYYYEKLFPNFDYSKATFTSNIVENYITSEKARYQLLKRVKDGKKTWQIKYTDYQFANQNFYDYLKSFYYGGLNFYNQEYLNTLIKEDCFAIDINSSYPNVIFHNKIPYRLKWFRSFTTPQSFYIDTENYDEFTLFKVSQEQMNEFLDEIDSITVRRMIVKYFKVIDGYCSINTNTIRMINKFSRKRFKTFKVLNYVTFECEFFDARDKIKEYYFIKTQGKLSNKIEMETPSKYKILEEKNDVLFSEEEIYNSKVMLNGIYGAPALRAFYNLFRVGENDTIESYPSGFKNSERNIIFSIFVTSQALYNLLEPLTYLTYQEIDTNFLYADTDSLYMKKEILHKLPDSLFDDIALGAWGVDDAEISEFFVLNHKKYCYYSKTKKKGIEKGVILKCGGIPLSSFNKDFDNLSDFIESEFHKGKKVKNKRNIYTKEKTIAIYDTVTELDIGLKYFSKFNERFEEYRNGIIEHIRQTEDSTNEVNYYSTPFGNITDLDIHPSPFEHEHKKDLKSLQYKEHIFERLIDDYE